MRHATRSNAGKFHLGTSANMNIALCMVPDIKIALQYLTKKHVLEKMYIYLLVCNS